ncbi:hypothetical protein ACQKWADRAFT_306249 [Trichoderma austrokoningii]
MFSSFTAYARKMSTTSSFNIADGSHSQVHPCTASQSQEEPVSAINSGVMLSMSFLFSRLQASTCTETLCKAVSSLKKMKAGFWSHAMIAVPLLIAILTLWPTFSGTAEAKKATELTKWTAKKDFMEFCQTFDWEPDGCDVHPNFLGPPPVLRRQLPSWSPNTRIGSAFHYITLVALSFGIFCLMVNMQQRRMRSIFHGSFHKLSCYRYSRQVLSTSLLSILKASDTEKILQFASIAHSTGLETTDRAPRRRLMSSGSRYMLQNSPLEAHDRTEDDNGIKLHPERQVDYLSHVWQEEDLHQSWRHVQSQKTNYENATRLENAAWRSWTQFRHNLPTISPTQINWSKEENATWLYGPLQPQSVELYGLTSHIEENKREGASKIEITKRTAEGNQYVTRSGLDESATITSRQRFRQGGNLKHGRHFGKPCTNNPFSQVNSKKVRFTE